jgi:hypothetical protein
MSFNKMEARGGIEPPIRILPILGLPLGYRALGNNPQISLRAESPLVRNVTGRIGQVSINFSFLVWPRIRRDFRKIEMRSHP